MQALDTGDERLWHACKNLPSDWEPHGQRHWVGRPEARPDCATCLWFAELFHAWPEWGVCTNPESPRSGLLTYFEQGCWQHEPGRCPRHRRAWRERCGFKDSFERALREQAAAFIREEVRKANDPLADEESSPAKQQNLRGTPLFTILRGLAAYGDGDFCRATLKRMAASAKDTRRYWEVARRHWASTVRVDPSEIRLPENVRELEGKFWRRVDTAIRELLETRAPRRKRRRKPAHRERPEGETRSS